MDLPPMEGHVSGPTPQDVREVEVLLGQQGLPVELVRIILNKADYRPSETIGGYGEHEIYANNTQGYHTTEELYSSHRLRYIDGGDVPVEIQEEGRWFRVERIEWTIESHDQGWSDFRKHHGTYERSRTWFAATLVLPEQPVNPAPTIHGITYNLHAVNDWNRQHVVWHADHPLVAELNEHQGPRGIVVLGGARELNWINYVRFVEAKIFYQML